MASKEKVVEERDDEALKAKEALVDDPWELVSIRVKRDDTEDQDLFIGFNGKNYILPKGKVSQVPRCVAEELYRSRRAQEIADEHIDDLLAKSEEAEAYLR